MNVVTMTSLPAADCSMFLPLRRKKLDDKAHNGVQTNVASHHLVDSQGRTIEKNAEKAEILAKNYTKVSSSANYSDTFRKRKTEIEEDADHLKNDAITNDQNMHMNIPFSEQELKSALRQSKWNTSPGEDGIRYDFLKQLPGAGQRMLLKL